jgi:D-tagatose-1,6-bisphosphate aldolase subunit GatZ/KbaZ
MRAILDVIARHKAGEPCGMFSACSAHPLVIEATLLHARRSGARFALIEATSNQVNQAAIPAWPGGFRLCPYCRPRRRAAGARFLGGDHLGPNAWQGLPAEEVMAWAKCSSIIRYGFRRSSRLLHVMRRCAPARR